MKAKHVLTILILCVLVAQTLMTVTSPARSYATSAAVVPQPTMQEVEASDEKEAGPLVTNVVYNGGFEEYDSQERPQGWSSYGSSYRVSNATYQGDVYGGSYSGNIKAQGTNISGSDAYLRTYTNNPPRPYLSQGIHLEFYFNIASCPDLQSMGSYACNVEVQVYKAGYWYYLFYLLLYRAGLTNINDSYGVYYKLNQTIGSWQFMERNMTSDFEAAGWGAVGDAYVYRVYWHVFSPDYATGLTEMTIDDCNIANQTNYEFIQNGDFETGSGLGWNQEAQMPAHIGPSSDSTQGAASLNLTASSASLHSTSYVYSALYRGYPAGWFASDPRTGRVEFDWKYSDVYNGGDQQYAYFEVYFQNESQYVYLRWYLGSNMDINYQTNSSYYLNWNATGFGSRGTWQHFSVDLYEVFREVYLTDGTIYGVQFYVVCGPIANSSVTLLIDDFKYITYPAYDPGFEQDWYYDSWNPLAGWYTSPNGVPFLNRTPDSHKGKWAANLTSSYGGASGAYRNSFVRVDKSMYTDFWWRLDSVSSSTTYYYSYVRLLLDTYSITYVLSMSGTVGFSNDTSNVAYLVDGFNVTGIWHNVARNLTADLDAAFGPRLWNITLIQVYAYSDSDPVSVIFDDMNFIDAVPPEISSVQETPADPMYYEPVLTRAIVSDNLAGVMEVQLYYRSGGPWSSEEAVLNGGYYEAWMPAYPYGTVVQWYYNATDWCGSWGVADNGGLCYSYTIGDDVPPELSITAPEDGRTVSGLVLLSAAANDIGSGVKNLTLLDDGSPLFTDNSPPYQYMWNTRSVSNGSHVITCVSYDNADVMSTTTITLDVQNDVAAPALSSVQISPVTPQFDQDVSVLVGVVDATSVDNVTLHYKFGVGSWSAQEMTASGALYMATIPGASAHWNVQVSYYVVAYDVFGYMSAVGSSVSPMTYTVADLTPPSINIMGPPLGKHAVGLVNFTFHASDLGSGVNVVEFRVDDTPVESFTEETGTVHWDTKLVVNGNHTLTFQVEDVAGNPASIDLIYYVDNPQGLGLVTAALSSFLSSYGFFVGAGVVVALYAIGKVLVSRRAAGAGAAAPPKKTKK